MEMRQMDELHAYLAGEVKACQDRGLQLSADFRADEAGLEKIKANIYGIFLTVLETAARTAPEGEEGAMRWFEKKLAQIPVSWQVSLDAAREHADTGRIVVEEAKLETVRKIRDQVERIGRDVHV